MSRIPSILLLAAFLLLPLGAKGEEGGEESPVSGLPRRCGVCHLDRIRSSAGGFNFLSLRSVDLAGARAICYSCHSGLVKDSRRSIWTGLQHRADDPSGEPGPGRRAACGTCHDPHVQTGGVATFMRYSKGYSQHCQKCHPGRRGGLQGEHPPISSASGGESGGGCQTCHMVHKASGQGLIRSDAAGNLCTRCHGDNPSREGKGTGMESHPSDSRVISCVTCHAVHGSTGRGLVKVKAADGTLCLGCHETHAPGAGREGNHPLAPGEVECLSCHRLHNGGRLDGKGGLLKAPDGSLDALCSGCHGQMKAGAAGWNHPVGVTVPTDVEGKIAKLAAYGGHIGPAGEVRCLSCHRSHNAVKETAQLVVSRQALCLYCHVEQNALAPAEARFGTHPIFVKPEKAAISPRLIEAGGLRGESGELICLTCHKVHGSEKEMAGLVLPRSEYGCTLCHSEKSDIASTSHNLVGEGGADPCLSCHGQHGWAIPLEKVTMGGSVVDKVCWYCHGAEGTAPMSGVFGHIVGVPPSGSAGAGDLPLFWEDGRRLQRGIITCATCHDPHRDPAENFLRIDETENRSDLCLDCHRRQEAVKGTKHDIASFFPGEKNRQGERAEQTGVCGACHLVHSGGPGESWARDVVMIPGTPGQLHLFCGDCHREGSFAQGKTIGEKTHPSADVLEARPDLIPVDCDGCHDSHVWNPSDLADKGDFFADGDGGTSFLVSPAGEESPLCRKCHAAQAQIAETRHDFTGGKATQGDGSLCGSCHIPHGGQSLLMWPVAQEKEDSYGTETCLGCHGAGKPAFDEALAGNNHPVGVSPGPDTGDDLPLFLPSGRRYFRGNVSCATCHDPHRWSPASREGFKAPSDPGPTTSFLRLASDGFSPLCFPCHSNRSMVVGTDHDLRVTAPEATNSDGLTTAESGVCGSCHRPHGARQPIGLWNRGLGPGEDPQSRYCRSCHEEGAMEEASSPRRMESHLVSYPGKGMVSRIFTQRERSLLNISSTFFLFNEEGEKKDRGYISCATCHDVHRWEADTTRSGTGVALDGDARNSFLKVRNTFAVGRSFCKECHGDNTLEFYQNYHFPGDQAKPAAGR